MATMLLTEISVRALKGSDRYEKFFDTKTAGFGIRVGKRSKTWIVMRGRNRELITIGKYPELSLSDARTDLSVIQLVRQGKYDSAKAIADRAVAAKLEQNKNLLDALKLNYEDNKDLFTTADSRAFESTRYPSQAPIGAVCCLAEQQFVMRSGASQAKASLPPLRS